MALGALPYKYVITSWAKAPNGVDVTITFNITDTNGIVMATDTTTTVNPNVSADTFFNTMRDAVLNQMLSDAGTPLALLSSLKNVPIVISQ